MQDHIEEHFCDPITLNDLSEAAGYSASHSLRIFKELTGITPFDYIRQYRLTHGAKLLRDKDPKVSDVAAGCVFETHEGFTRAFSKEFGISPESYREDPIPVRYFIPYSVLIRHLHKSKRDEKMERKEKKTVFVQTIERPERKAIIKRGCRADNYYEYCDEVGCDVWGVLESIKSPYEPAGFWLPAKLIREGTSKYVQGVEVPLDHKGTIPGGFEVIDLERCSFMIFRGEPFDEEDFEEAIGDVKDSVERYDPSLDGYEWACADAPAFQLMPVGSRGYIEARPVRIMKK